jgi:hypothetical protein
MYLAGFLIASGKASLVQHRKIGRQSQFDFEESDELQKLIEAFFTNRAKVSPLDYGNALRNLKSLIYGDNQNINNHNGTE